RRSPACCWSKRQSRFTPSRRRSARRADASSMRRRHTGCSGEDCMKIKSVEAHWVHIPIPPERQHTSDFGRTLSFDGTVVRIDTECGLTGWGEAKAQVGGMAQNQALTAMINEEFGRLLVGEDPRDITRLWETLYSGSRAHYALREGRVLPVLGRRGIKVSAISGVDCAL